MVAKNQDARGPLAQAIEHRPLLPGCGGAPIMPPSTKAAPIGAMISAIRATVPGEIALQSAKSGFGVAEARRGAMRSANAIASPGSTMERTRSD
jgi:hypothetical protein